MKPELYAQFNALKNSGRRPEAKLILAEFIASFQTVIEREIWVREFLHSQEFGHKIRHEIYRQLVFPLLLDGYTRADAWSVFNLAKTAQNLYDSQALHAKIDFQTEWQLLAKAYDLQPDEPTRQRLLIAHIEGFRYRQHEWPAGILVGANSANLEQCDDILQVIARVRKLDSENLHANFLNEFAEKVGAYKTRLTR